jgi:EAL and modified HD-GYP domain-containing signal transduction protein
VETDLKTAEPGATGSPTPPLAFLARQGICDGASKVVAYELLYRRSGAAVGAEVLDDVQATLHVIVNTALEIGLERLSNKLPVHINYPTELLEAAVPPPFPAARVVIEVLEGVRCTEGVLDGLAAFRAGGYRIALDDFNPRSSDPKLLDFADMVKLDISEFELGRLPALIHELKKRPVTLVAERVETAADFERCVALGFDAYQGYFLQHPEMFSARPVPGNRRGALRLVAALQSVEPSIAEVAKLISQDVSLSYQLLRCINSSYFGFTKKVESIRQAIVMLGLEKLRQLCALVALSQIDQRPQSVLLEAIIRARMCETLGTLRGTGETSALFITGLFSTLDVLTGTPMSDLLKDLPLTGAVSKALLTRQGPLGLILSEAIAYERGAWNAAVYRGVKPAQAQEAYLDAVSWAQTTQAMTSG